MVRANQLVLPHMELQASALELDSIMSESLKILFLKVEKAAELFAADISFPHLPGQPKVHVSGQLMQLIGELVHNLAVGNAVAIVGVPPHITVGEAAELLGLSHDEALKLVKWGDLELKQLESEEMTRRLTEAIRKSEEAQAVGQ